MTWEESMDHTSEYGDEESYDLYRESSIASDIWFEISSDIVPLVLSSCSRCGGYYSCRG
jgi:hypothetical protein